ncbi:MAG TPA: glycosyltransferase family 4 protein [Candidatus Synoicihabitans sp.]|nr:glycosyltransferase family 4 protein [Candidatus Synoicihabitans sp.]
MNLLMLNYEYPPLGGGGGVIHRQIAEELANRHRVTVITSAFRGLPRHEHAGGVEIFRVPVIGRWSRTTASLVSMLSYYPASLRCARRLITQRPPTLINSHFAVPTGPSAMRLARQFRLPHVLSIHGGDIYDPTKTLSPHRLPAVRGLVRRVLVQADRIVAPSRNTRANAQRYYAFSGAIEVIPHGLKHPDLPPRARAELGLTEVQRVVATVGRLVLRKGVAQLVHLIAALGDAQVVLVVVGDGPERERLQTLAHRLGLGQRVRFVGAVDDAAKYRWLQAADVFVSASVHEGFGLMYLEAMHCGLPIVAYDHGGQEDFLADGITGYLVPLGAESSFCDRLRLLLEQPTLRTSIGRHNRNVARAFTIESCAGQYETVYREVLATTEAGAFPAEP